MKFVTNIKLGAIRFDRGKTYSPCVYFVLVPKTAERDRSCEHLIKST